MMLQRYAFFLIIDAQNSFIDDFLCIFIIFLS